jgi:hypothetical protein
MDSRLAEFCLRALHFGCVVMSATGVVNPYEGREDIRVQGDDFRSWQDGA